MKQVKLIFIFVMFAGLASGQTYQIPLSLISSSGGNGQATINGGTNAHIDWTLGEVITGAGAANGHNITIGQQQGLPDTLAYPLGIKEDVFASIKIYPNPASSYIRIDNMPDGAKSISLIDVTGRIIQTLNTEDDFQTVSTANLSAGIYTLTICKGVDTKTSFKIIITNK